MINNLDIFLISEEYVKQQSSVMQNVEDGFFRAHIIESQNIQLQSIICDELYTVIVTEFDDYKQALSTGSTQPITAYVEERILDLVDNYIQPLLLYYTLYNSSYDFYSKITNKGIVNQESDSSKTAEMIMMEKMRKDWKHKAEHYTIVISKFLVANTDLYPEYLSCITECENPTSKSNGVSIYLGKEL